MPEDIASLQRQVKELTDLVNKVITPDGVIRATQIATLPKDTSVTTATGSVRIETNLGPVNVLIT